MLLALWIKGLEHLESEVKLSPHRGRSLEELYDKGLLHNPQNSRFRLENSKIVLLCPARLLDCFGHIKISCETLNKTTMR